MELQSTPLSAWHIANQARMVDFAGYQMPVQYSSIVQEHAATRTAAGLFDISHMGRLRFEGNRAHELLDHLGIFVERRRQHAKGSASSALMHGTVDCAKSALAQQGLQVP